MKWHIFSKHTQKSYVVNNCFIKPVSAKEFTTSFTSCEGTLCGAGFETPAEALYMGKKIMVIPMKSQYEQHCNAAAAAELGVPVIKKLKSKYIHLVDAWLNHTQLIQVDYKDETSKIIDRVLSLSSLPLPGILKNNRLVKNEPVMAHLI